LFRDATIIDVEGDEVDGATISDDESDEEDVAND
jgi:hypothetical protein